MVYIIEKKYLWVVSGYLKFFFYFKERFDGCFFLIDSWLLRFCILWDNCLLGFFNRLCDFENILYVVCIVSWFENFFWDLFFVIGLILWSLGEVGEIEFEIEGIFFEYGIDFGFFLNEVLVCLF